MSEVYLKKEVGNFVVRVVQLTTNVVELQARRKDKVKYKGIAGRRNEKQDELIHLAESREALSLDKLEEAYDHY